MVVLVLRQVYLSVCFGFYSIEAHIAFPLKFKYETPSGVQCAVLTIRQFHLCLTLNEVKLFSSILFISCMLSICVALLFVLPFILLTPISPSLFLSLSGCRVLTNFLFQPPPSPSPTAYFLTFSCSPLPSQPSMSSMSSMPL